MRVACIGNMNNNFFVLTRYLRDYGYDTDLLLFNNELSHFHPSADSFDSAYDSFTRQLAWGDLVQFAEKSTKNICEDLKPYDILIGCGAAPAYVQKSGRRLDVFSPYGADIYELTEFRFSVYGLTPRYWRQILKWQSERWKLARYQRMGIGKSACIVSNNPTWYPYFRKCRFSGAHYEAGIPLVYTPMLTETNLRRHSMSSSVFAEVNRLTAGYELKIFHGSRHVWKTNSNRYAWKGNDILVNGFAKFVAARPSIKSCLVMCEYGPDVDRTKALVTALGIGERVFWLKQMLRKDILVLLSLMDVAAVEFAHSWLSGGCIFEGFAMGKPVMQFRNDDLYRNAVDELPPIINAGTPDDIATALTDIAERPEYYRAIGEAGRAWHQRHVVERSIAAFNEILSRRAQDN